MISPCPFIGIIILVHFRETCIDGFQTIDCSILNTIQQSVDFTLGSNQSGNIHPFAKSDFRAVKVKECVAVPKSKKLLQFTLDDGTGTDRTILSGVSQELVNGDFIKTNSVIQRRVLDFSTLVGVDL